MTDSTRRTFLSLSGAAAASVASLGVTALTPGTALAAASTPEAPATAPAAGTPLVAVIKDAATGEIALLVGEREVIVRDHALVAQLLRAAA